MLTRYDPDRAPDPRRWLNLLEGDRIDLVQRYHRKAGIRPPNETVHAAIHAVVETQVAMGDETPAAATLERLMHEGLTRHEAVHAIGMVLAEHLYGVMKTDDEDPDADPNEPYFQRLRALTAEEWLQSGEEEDPEDDDG
jgi:hypothetical protein